MLSKECTERLEVLAKKNADIRAALDIIEFWTTDFNCMLAKEIMEATKVISEDLARIRAGEGGKCVIINSDYYDVVFKLMQNSGKFYAVNDAGKKYIENDVRVVDKVMDKKREKNKDQIHL